MNSPSQCPRRMLTRHDPGRHSENSYIASHPPQLRQSTGTSRPAPPGKPLPGGLPALWQGEVLRCPRCARQARRSRRFRRIFSRPCRRDPRFRRRGKSRRRRKKRQRRHFFPSGRGWKAPAPALHAPRLSLDAPAAVLVSPALPLFWVGVESSRACGSAFRVAGTAPRAASGACRAMRGAFFVTGRV